MMISILEIWVVMVSGSAIIFFHLVSGVYTLSLLGQVALASVIVLASWIFLRFLTRMPLIRAIIKRASGVASLPQPDLGLYVLSVVLYGIMWFLYGLVLSGVVAIMASQKLSYLPGTSAYFAISWMAGFLAIIIPSGFGVRELALVSLLSNFPEIRGAQLGAAAVLMRVIVIFGELLWLGLSQAIVLLINRATRFFHGIHKIFMH
jgi:hypothetical protein